MAQKILLPKPSKTHNLFFQLPITTAGKFLGASLAGLLILGGCASAPEPPTAELQAAEQAISSAERARVTDYASVELSEARDKLSAARRAVQDKEMVQAQHLAQQARLDAELASARAEVAKAREVNEQMQKGIDTLKMEMQRKTGEQ